MLDSQFDLFGLDDYESEPLIIAKDTDLEVLDLESYDMFLVMFSGGKDCLASLLYLLEQGISKDRIELWHHCVDGYEPEKYFMDWPVTEDYCRKLADAFGLKLYFSWKSGGFKGEMLRENERTKPTYYQTPEGTFSSGGTSGKFSTRRMFPQLAASLQQRWCSAYLKVDVGAKAITGQERFNHSRTAVVTGERAEESSARSKYSTFEPHRSDRRDGRSKRHVDAIRPVHKWSEQEVWDIIERWKVQPHPAYRMQFGRLSCMSCIFASDRQWASIKLLDPERFEEIAGYEDEFGKTIHRKKHVRERIEGKEPYEAITPELAKLAMSREYTDSIFVENWELPAGAFGESNGPT
jgi:3'-phosphoadenosine 5'-phosphosulfate sulfotransferase (PAPS reductase)/FAD synthetase